MANDEILYNAMQLAAKNPEMKVEIVVPSPGGENTITFRIPDAIILEYLHILRYFAGEGIAVDDTFLTNALLAGLYSSGLLYMHGASAAGNAERARRWNPPSAPLQSESPS